MSGGRPTHYSDEIARKAREYLEIHAELGDVVPSVAGLSVYIERARSTIYQWASHEDNTEFADILERINATQEKKALSGGLSGDYNSAIVKLLLGKHGYHDKVDQELTGKGGGAIEHSVITFVGIDASSD